MNKILGFSILILVMFSCKKANERRCYKSHGELDSMVYSLESGIYEFDLGKRIRYRIFQDSSNQVIVRGGENMISFVRPEQSDSTLTIRNQNRCNFLRSKDEYIEVDIYYDTYQRIKCDPTDSLVFMDTISADYLDIYLVDGGGYMRLNTLANHLRLDVTGGVTHFDVAGEAVNQFDLFVHILSYGNAEGLKSKNAWINNNTTGDLYVNLDSTVSRIQLRGTGDIYYSGTPDSLNIEKTGDGNLIPF
jgi:hypothetical protein